MGYRIAVVASAAPGRLHFLLLVTDGPGFINLVYVRIFPDFPIAPRSLKRRKKYMNLFEVQTDLLLLVLM